MPSEPARLPSAAPRAPRRWSAAALALMVALSWAAPGLAQQVIHTEDSSFSPIVIYELRGERCMAFGSIHAPGRQTCQSLEHPERMVFQYTKMVMSALWLQPEPSRILIVGLGGGTLPTALASLLPDATIDTVEIDSAVAKVAQTYFGYQPGERQRLHLADGRAYVEDAVRRGDTYDLVILDAFDATYIPAHLTTREFLQQVRQLLTPGGVLAANTFTSSQLYERESATYAEVFGPYYQLRAGNRVILAKPDGLPPVASLREQAQRQQAALTPLGVDGRQLLGMLGGVPPWPAGTTLLTDP